MSDITKTLPTAPLTRAALATRQGHSVPAPPVRSVHLGLGAFHRAHQAWYTSKVDDHDEWGIAAFTGRNPTAARDLSGQDGLFTVIERSEAGDSATVVTSLVEAVDGADLVRLVQLMAASTTAIVTLTVTEAGYRVNADGLPNLDDPAVAADVEWLKDAFTRPSAHSSWLTACAVSGPTTPLGRLILGLDVRRRNGGGPLALLSCDNIPHNGALLRGALLALAQAVGGDTAEWIAANGSFVSTSVDRITPRTTPEDLAVVRELTGWSDQAAVVTEPYHDWVLSGPFPAGRPAWEQAGARFVDDIEPFERRKLWLLNGAHTLLAYAGLGRGHATVAAAMADPVCRHWVIDFWAEASRNLPTEGLALESYRASLVARFDNPRIAHQLAQIARDGTTKLRVRVAPAVLAERAAGRTGSGGIRALGAWVALVWGGHAIGDSASADINNALGLPFDEALVSLLSLVDPRLPSDSAVLAGVASVVGEAPTR